MDTQHQQQDKAEDKAAPETPRANGSSTHGGAGESPRHADAAGAAPAAPEPQGSPAETPSAAGRAPLAPGTRVGGYVVGRLVHDVAGQRIYLASAAEPSAEDAVEESETRFLLQLLQPGSAATAGTVEAIVGSGLRHPRLLAPRERVPFEGSVYLVLEGLPTSESVPRVAADGARLSPTAALRAGAGLADALGYLHRSGLAHGHVAPDVIVLQGERAYLAGLEHVVMLDEPGRDALALMAEDANALASALGTLADLRAAPGAAAEAQETLATIAARGAAGAFTTPDEIGAAAGAGLLNSPQPLPPTAASTDSRLRLRYGFATTVGAVRSENQDATAAVVFTLTDDVASAHLPIGVFLVADGMGGEAHGELASRIAARVTPAELLRLYVLPLIMHPTLAITAPELPAPEATPAALAQALGEAVATANRQIREMAEYYRQDTGSTLTALAVSGAQGVIAHLGDSRAYLLRGGAMVQLTEDHTLLARLHAMDHPILSDSTMYVPRNFLYRSLGQEQAPPDLLELSLAPGDRVLICSDGLWDEVDDATIARQLAAPVDPAKIAERLVELANAGGGHDNSTALVLFIEAAPAPATVGGGEAPHETDAGADAEAGARS